MIEITEQQIDTQRVLESVGSNECGANVLFVGMTRQFTAERETMTLNYECYAEMALSTMRDLADQARAKWPVKNVSIVHRIGEVAIGQASIAVAVSSPHRRDSFDSASWLLEALKKQVPIWKKEHWADGSTDWVHPDGATPTMNHPDASVTAGDND